MACYYVFIMVVDLTAPDQHQLARAEPRPKMNHLLLQASLVIYLKIAPKAVVDSAIVVVVELNYI